MFRDKFWITLLLSIPTLMERDGAAHVWLSAPTFPGSGNSRLFGTAVYFYGGLVFVKGGLQELRDRKPGMMTLISLAITVAFVFSLAVTLGYPGEALWWEAAPRDDHAARSLDRDAIDLAGVRCPARAGETAAQHRATHRRRDHRRCSRSRRCVRATSCWCDRGDGVPADGIVQSGKSDVNESMITGESVPVARSRARRSSPEPSTVLAPSA